MKKLHFAWFGANGPAGWRAESGEIYDWRGPQIYQDIARLCERAKFDLLLFADTLALPSLFQGSHQHYVKTGFMVHHDPIPTITMMAAATSRIGVGSTLSSTFYPPFILARMLATLDHLSAGRVAWNVVTTATREAAQNFGLDDLPDHDTRYDMADEYLDLCRKLWDSWEPDALIMDRKSGIFGDPRKVHELNFNGKYYKCRGPLNVVSSPQRHPVIIMAGTSPRGQRFAVQNADMVIAHKNNVEQMREYSDQLRKHLSDAGRDPGSCKIFFSIKPVLGETEDQAREKWERHIAQADVDVGLADLSTTLGHDMSKFDLDAPLPASLKVNAIVGKVLQYKGRSVTLREIALHEAAKETFPICGTAEFVADAIEHAAREGGADGFHFRTDFIDYNYLVDIATKLVPVLQSRGLARTEYSGTTLREHLFEF